MANLLVMKTYWLLVVQSLLSCVAGSQALNSVMLCPEKLYGWLGMCTPEFVSSWGFKSMSKHLEELSFYNSLKICNMFKLLFCIYSSTRFLGCLEVFTCTYKLDLPSKSV